MAGEEIKISPDDRPIVEPNEGVEELRRKLKEETDRRLAAEARESKLAEDLQHTKGEVGQTHQQIVESAIDKLTAERQIIAQRKREARAAGDMDVEFSADEELADNAAKLNQLKLGLEAMKAAPTQTAQPVAQRTGDPVEDLARGMEREGHKESADWIRKHPEYARDPDMYREMLAAHNIAVGPRFRLRPNSPEYLAKVEEVLGIEAAARHEPHNNDVQPNGHAPVSTAAAPVRERTADNPPAAAPPSRGGGKTALRLTPEQREAAKISGISEEEYAANLQRGKN